LRRAGTPVVVGSHVTRPAQPRDSRGSCPPRTGTAPDDARRAPARSPPPSSHTRCTPRPARAPAP
jgi:hypothetical protein